MCYRSVSALAATAIIFASSATAGTVLQNIRYSFLEGPLSGTVVEVDYSYPTLPPGEPIYAYQPAVEGTATYLDAVSDRLEGPLLVFSDSLDILKPEPYLYFSFDPAANSTGLTTFNVYNTSSIGIFFEDDPDIIDYVCGGEVDCVFSGKIAPIPLPSSLPLLLGALGVLAIGARRYRS